MKRKHFGSKFEDFLAEEGILEQCRAAAIKFKLAHELQKAMNEQNISKALYRYAGCEDSSNAFPGTLSPMKRPVAAF